MRTINFPSSVHGQSAVQIRLPSHQNLLLAQHGAPHLRPVDFRVLIREINHSLGCDAALVIRHPQRLAIRLLRLLDGHSHRQSDTDVQLFSGTVAEVQQRAVPDAGRAVQLPCLLDSLVYILPVIHVDDSLEHEALGLGILLSAHIVLEDAVVGTEERQFALQPVLRLLHRLLVVGIHLRDRQFAPNLLDHLPDFRRCNHLVIHRQTVGKHLPLIALAIRVQCNYMLCFCHVISLIKDWFVG